MQAQPARPAASANGRTRHAGGSVSSAPAAAWAASPNSSPSSSPGGGARLSPAAVNFSPALSLNRAASAAEIAEQAAADGDDFVVGAQPDDVFGGEAMSAEAVERLMRDASLVDAPESDGSSLFDSLQRGAGRSVTMGANLDSVYSSFTDKRGPARESRPFVVRQRLGYIPQGDGVSDVDPQNIYPASSCVFVANLPEPIDDIALEAEVTRAFSQFGTVFVKIRRDAKNMPFAFCQFTEDKHAQAAVINGRGIRICSRPCRTEMVKANCKFTISKRRGIAITLEEAREVLGEFGIIKGLEFLRVRDEGMLGASVTVLVEYTSFSAARDVVSHFRHHDKYHVEAFDIKKRGRPEARVDPNEEYLEGYATKRRSIYVGGLPSDVSEEGLRSFFGKVGIVRSVQIVDKPSYNSGPDSQRVFAFVEFDRPDTPDAAIAQFDGSLYGNRYPIKVERKVDKQERAQARRFQPQRYVSRYVSRRTEATSPQYTSPGQSGDIPTAQAYRPQHAPAPVGPTSPQGNTAMTARNSTGFGGSTPMTSTLSSHMAPTTSLTPPVWNLSVYNPTAYYPGPYVPSPSAPYCHVNNGGLAVTPQATPAAAATMTYYQPGYLPMPYYPVSVGDVGTSPAAPHGGYVGGAGANSAPRGPDAAGGEEQDKTPDPPSTA